MSTPTPVIIRPLRGFRNITLSDGSTLPDITADAVIEEQHIDTLEITEHPVEQGASIADHAYKRPAELVLHLGWTDSYDGADKSYQSTVNGADTGQIKAIYQKLLDLQASQALFNVYTGKRFYSNMVCKSLTTETDYKSAHSLPIKMTCQQVILVQTQTVMLDKKYQAKPDLTASTVDNGQQSVRKGL